MSMHNVVSYSEKRLSMVGHCIIKLNYKIFLLIVSLLRRTGILNVV
jgi:hypothetical protein